MLPHPEHGKGLVLVSEVSRLKKLQQVVDSPTPRGKEQCSLALEGCEVFALESAMEGAQYISLDPEDPTPHGPGRFTMLTTPVFVALKAMAVGLKMERALARIVAAGADGGNLEAASAEVAMFTQHVFFCFDTCQPGATGIQPLNAPRPFFNFG